MNWSGCGSCGQIRRNGDATHGWRPVSSPLMAPLLAVDTPGVATAALTTVQRLEQPDTRTGIYCRRSIGWLVAMQRWSTVSDG